MDTVDKETRSRIMSAVRSKNTKLEQTLIAALESADLLGFERYVKSLPGTPDVAFMEQKVAVFFDSCFWHGCPKHLRKPGSNQEYWRPKIENNAKRDRRRRAALRRMGWSVLRVWEHDLKNLPPVINRIRRILVQRGWQDNKLTGDNL